MEERKIIKKKLANTLLSVLTIVVLVISAYTNLNTAYARPHNTPKLDEIWLKYIAIGGEIDALLAGDVDTLTPTVSAAWPDIERVLQAGFVSKPDLGKAACWIVFNCRDKNPWTNQSLWPTNETAFRQALTWCFGHDSKEQIFAELFGGPLVQVMDTWMNPIYVDYYNPDVPVYYTSFEQAEQVLIDAGYYVSDGLLFGPNDEPLPDTIPFLVSSGAAQIIGYNIAENVVNVWNDFFDIHLGVTNVNFGLDPVAYSTWTSRVPWKKGDFWVTIQQWGSAHPGQYAKYCYSADDMVPYSNFAGVHDPEADPYALAVLNSLNSTERFEGSKKLQELLAERCWYIPLYTVVDYWFVDPDLTDYVRGYGVGFEHTNNAWSWRILRWTDPSKTTVTRWIKSKPDRNFNPLYDVNMWFSCGSEVLFDAIFDCNPWNELQYIPWIAEFYNTTSITTPWGQPGYKIYLKIREGIYWHDSGAYNDTNSNGQWDSGEPIYEYPVKAEDVAYTVSFARTHSLPPYASLYKATAIYEEIVLSPMEVELYVNSTDIWALDFLRSFALRMGPKHILETVTSENINEFDPAGTSYKEWTGLNPPDWTKDAPFVEGKGGMKALIGCGPFVFDFWSDAEARGHFIRNPNYWCDWTREDINFDLKVNILDISLAAKAFGSSRGSIRFTSAADIDINENINIVDLAKIAKAFGWIGL